MCLHNGFSHSKNVLLIILWLRYRLSLYLVFLNGGHFEVSFFKSKLQSLNYYFFSVRLANQLYFGLFACKESYFNRVFGVRFHTLDFFFLGYLRTDCFFIFFWFCMFFKRYSNFLICSSFSR
jgi:hypothetical protein